MFRRIFSLLLTLLAVSLVASRAVDQPTKISLETPKEILDNSIIRTPSRWERSMELLGQIMDALRIGRGRLVNFAMMARNVIAERAEEFASEATNTVAAVLAAREARRIAAEQLTAKKTEKKPTGPNIELKISTKIEPKTEKPQTKNIEKIESNIEKIEPKKVGKSEEKKPEKRSAVETSSSTPIKIGPLDSFLPPKTRESVRLESEGGQSLFEVKKEQPAQGLFQSFFMPTPLVDRIKEEEKYGNSGDRFIGIGRALVNGFESLSNFLNAVVDLPGKAAKQTSRSITKALNQVGGKLVGLE